MMYALLAAATIPTPSPAQRRYMATDFIALIHFNMGTFAHNGAHVLRRDKLGRLEGAVRHREDARPATFNPVKLNTTQWFDSINALGANIAILTAKHGCGFLLWPTAATLPDGSAYGYNVGAKGAAIQRDVLREFVDAADAAGVGYGFYYSIMKSFYLCHSRTRAPTRAARRSSPASTTSRPTSTRRSSTRTSARSGRTTRA